MTEFNWGARRAGAARLVFLLALLSATSDATVGTANVKREVPGGRHYKQHDLVQIDVNKINPYHNPIETYRYYSLPFCQGHVLDEEKLQVGAQEGINKGLRDDRSIRRQEKLVGALEYQQTLGESLIGERRETSPYRIHFLDNIERRLLCKTVLSKKDAEVFREAIQHKSVFEMFVEDLAMWGYVGDPAGHTFESNEAKGLVTYLFTHLRFVFAYNGDQIVRAWTTTDYDSRVDITQGEHPKTIEFSYSVEWIEDHGLTWKDRFLTSEYPYADARFLPSGFDHHYQSVLRTLLFVLVVSLLFTIRFHRCLKKIHSSYTKVQDTEEEARYLKLANKWWDNGTPPIQLATEDTEEQREFDWTAMAHTSVFSFPENITLFCAAVGTGNQLLLLTLSQLALGLVGAISATKRGSILAGVVLLYCPLSLVGGYAAVRLFRQLTGKKDWMSCALITAGLFPTPVAIVFTWTNTVALAYGSSMALPTRTLFACLALYSLVSFPLTMLGGYLAKDTTARSTTRMQTSREIPANVSWKRGRFSQIFLAACLPFFSLSTELHSIFSCMWGHQVYNMFGILTMMFVLLVALTCLLTLYLLLFQLERRAHPLWSETFCNGGMTGLVIYGISFSLFRHYSDMTGLLQLSFYFGYMAVVSFAFFLMLGSAGFQCSFAYVQSLQRQEAQGHTK